MTPQVPNITMQRQFDANTDKKYEGFSKKPEVKVTKKYQNKTLQICGKFADNERTSHIAQLHCLLSVK